jgi:Uma2 family endonuclease
MPISQLMSHFTYEDYKGWEDSWELIDGVPYAMAPAPYPKHQKIVFAISKELDKNLNCTFKDICEVYIAPVDWKIDDTSVVQPDVAVFCEKTQKQYFSKTPLLVVEVLSRATALKDTTTKFKLYQREGVSCYMIVDPNRQKAEIFELEDTKYKLAKEIDQDGKYLFLYEGCEVSVDFAVVFE